MARCLFGDSDAKRYDGRDQSMAQFKIAVESMKVDAE